MIPTLRGNDRLTLNIGEDAGGATPAAVVTLHCEFDPTLGELAWYAQRRLPRTPS